MQGKDETWVDCGWALVLTGIVAAGGVFDFNYVRSQVGEEHRRRWACEHAHEIEHSEALKWERHPITKGR